MVADMWAGSGGELVFGTGGRYLRELRSNDRLITNRCCLSRGGADLRAFRKPCGPDRAPIAFTLILLT